MLRSTRDAVALQSASRNSREALPRDWTRILNCPWARLVSSVETNLALHTYGSDEWRPPIVKTVATTGQGIPELVQAIARFRAHSQGVEASRRKTRSEYRLRELVSQRFMDHLERSVLTAGELGAIVDRIAAREVDPYSAANDLLRRALK